MTTSPFLHPQRTAIPERPVQSAITSFTADDSIRFYDSCFHCSHCLALVASAGPRLGTWSRVPCLPLKVVVVRAPAQHVDAETCKERKASQQAPDAIASQ